MVGTEGDDMQQLIDQVAHRLENPPEKMDIFAAFAALSPKEKKRVRRTMDRQFFDMFSKLTPVEIIRAAQQRDAARGGA